MENERLKRLLEGIEAVIFDLDGTLTDSMGMWKQIDIDYLAERGHEFPEDLQECIEGKSFSEMAVYFKERFSLSDTIEEIKTVWNEMAYDQYANKVNLKPGALMLLQYLRRKKIKTGIATSNSKELLLAVLDNRGLHEFFDEIHTACEVEKGKPSPDIYLFVAKTLKVEPQHCLVFEDVWQGIEAGKAAGMRVCAVKDDFSLEWEEEKRKRADDMIENFWDLFC